MKRNILSTIAQEKRDVKLSNKSYMLLGILLISIALFPNTSLAAVYIPSIRTQEYTAAESSITNLFNFDNNSVANSVSGGFSLTDTSTLNASGKYFDSRKADNAADRLDSSSDTPFTNPGTFEFYMKPNTTTPSLNVFYFYDGNSAPDDRSFSGAFTASYQLSITQNNGTSGGSKIITTKTAFTDVDRWYLITIVWDYGNFSVQVDGATENFTTSLNSSVAGRCDSQAQQFCNVLGGRAAGASQTALVELDEVAIFSIARYYSQNYTPKIYLDGLNQSRKYEYGTTATILANMSCASCMITITCPECPEENFT